MSKTALVLVMVAAVGLAACGKKTPPPAPAPPPVAPATPPPAPEPTRPPDVAPQVDEYTRLKQTPIEELERMGLMGDVRFDYDSADLREGDRAVLGKNAEVLKRYDFLIVSVEGHCDERGSVDYNLALGERRARAAYDYLVSLGVPAARLKTISYGKEVPVCSEANENCWARNRRAHFAITGKTTR
jgi:peptidoglycan-associated lipoprotein